MARPGRPGPGVCGPGRVLRLQTATGPVPDACAIPRSVVFDRASNSERVFRVDIINMKTTYQFDKHFSLRAIERYDSSQKRVLMDYLASFELVPGTVAYAGYGVLFDKQSWDGTRFIPGAGNYANTQRSLFFKVSYLHRF